MHHLDYRRCNFSIVIYFAADKLTAPKKQGCTDAFALSLECIFESFFQIALDIDLLSQEPPQVIIHQICLPT
jgi:hypothetical protein